MQQKSFSKVILFHSFFHSMLRVAFLCLSFLMNGLFDVEEHEEEEATHTKKNAQRKRNSNMRNNRRKKNQTYNSIDEQTNERV